MNSIAARSRALRLWQVAGLALALAIVAFSTWTPSARAASVFPGTGGEAITLDISSEATSPDGYAVVDIGIAEVDVWDFGGGNGQTVVLKAPAGFEFRPDEEDSSNSATVTPFADIDPTTVQIVVTADTATVTLDVRDDLGLDSLAIRLQVRPTTTTPTTGNIYTPVTGAGTFDLAGVVRTDEPDGAGGTSFAALTSVPGYPEQLAIVDDTVEGETFVAGDAIASLAIEVRDQFGNLIDDPTLEGSTTEVTATLNTAGDGVFVDSTIAVRAEEGVATFDDLAVDLAGDDYTITFNVFGHSYGASAEAVTGTFEITDSDATPTPTPTPTTSPADEAVPTQTPTLTGTTTVTPGTATQVGTSASDGSAVAVVAPAGVLPAGGTLTAGAIDDLDALIAGSPLPGTADIVVAFVIEAMDADGNALTEFDEPIDLEFTVPASSVPTGGTTDTLVLAFWNGAKWVEAEGTVTLNDDGSFTFNASVDHFTIFSVEHQPDRGQFIPAPSASGVSLTRWGGGGYALLTAGLAEGTSVWVTVDGDFVGYTVGAPAFVNAAFQALFPTTVDAGTVLIVVKP